MKRRKPKRLKATTLFDPDKIVTSMSQKLTLDLVPPEQMYGGDERTLKVFRETQLAAFCKKYVNQAGVANDSLEEKTFEKFLSVNSHMAAYRGISFPTVDHPRQTKCNAEKILLRARALMHFVIGSDFGFDEFFQDCKHGPGTTVGVPFEDTSMEQKFTYPISVTEDAKPLMEQYLLWDDRLTAAIERLNAGYYGNRYCEVQGSRATTVPKSNDIRRMIAVEPSANMFLQQGMMTMMYRRMKAVGLDVETLPLLHKRLALEGSLSGALATVDFSSASDCVSTELLRWLIPPRWFRVFDMIRCKSMKVGDQWVDLNMSSTMGNAVTFPLETLVFWTLGHATRLTYGDFGHSLFPEWEDLKRVSVFGDDCIVEDKLYLHFVEVCESVGFMVNKDKSFHGPIPFRESCGGDYLAGRDVRPFNIRPPSSTRPSALEPWLYTTANGLIKKYIQYFGTRNYVYDKRLFEYLFELFREHRLLVKVVPSDFPDDSGLKISEDLSRWRTSYNFRMNPISISDQGTYTFLYCSFRYRKERAQDEELRYYDWLRRPVRTRREPHHFKPIRRKGGYVVARALSSCMTVHDWRPRG